MSWDVKRFVKTLFVEQDRKPPFRLSTPFFSDQVMKVSRKNLMNKKLMSRKTMRRVMNEDYCNEDRKSHLVANHDDIRLLSQERSSTVLRERQSNPSDEMSRWTHYNSDSLKPELRVIQLFPTVSSLQSLSTVFPLQNEWTGRRDEPELRKTRTRQTILKLMARRSKAELEGIFNRKSWHSIAPLSFPSFDSYNWNSKGKADLSSFRRPLDTLFFPIQSNLLSLLRDYSSLTHIQRDRHTTCMDAERTHEGFSRQDTFPSDLTCAFSSLGVP
jgi:hypothetical protein